MTALLSIVIPTIPERERRLARTLKEIARHATLPYEVLVERGHRSCGPGWQAGGKRSRGDYLFFCADDLYPAADGWEVAAGTLCDRNLLPAPLIRSPDGAVESCGGSWQAVEPDGAATSFTRAPFVSRDQWEQLEPMLPCHYFTDTWVSERGRWQGMTTVVCHAFQLVHELAPEGRDDGRLADDAALFERAKQGEDVWLAS